MATDQVGSSHYLNSIPNMVVAMQYTYGQNIRKKPIYI